MSITRKQKTVLNLLIVALMMTLAIAAASFSSHAMSGLEASGQVNCASGAVLRSKASTKGKKLAVLPKGAVVEIQKEVFTTKKSINSNNIWYYVNTGAGYGYIRSDLVTINRYGRADAKATKKITCRRGAGTKMSKKRTISKNSTFTVLLEAKAKNSSAVWYLIVYNNKSYYVKKSNIILSNITTGLSPVAAASSSPAPEVVQSAEALAVVNGACAWAIQIAGDNRFHYGLKPMAQHNGCYFCGTQMLTGGRSKLGVNDYEFSYCCNPFVHAAFAHGGNEKTMLQVCKNGSSYDYHLGKGYDVSPLFVKISKPSMSQLKKGDVLCSSNHVVLYLGNGKIAEAAGGDDNVPYSDKWNNSIRVCTYTESRYSGVHGVYRYIGNQQ